MYFDGEEPACLNCGFRLNTYRPTEYRRDDYTRVREPWLYVPYKIAPKIKLLTRRKTNLKPRIERKIQSVQNSVRGDSNGSLAVNLSQRRKSPLNRILKLISKQWSIPWIGALKDLYASTSVYMGAINFILIAITAYGTTIGPMLRTPGAFVIYVPWMRLEWFILMLVAIVLILMLLEFKLVYHSYFAFRNKIGERLTEIEKALKIPKRS